MGILKDKSCPKCGCPDGLTICATVGAVNCYNCMEFIRVLTEEEKKKLEAGIEWAEQKVKERKEREIKGAPECGGCRK